MVAQSPEPGARGQTLDVSRSNWNLEVLVFAEGEKSENPEKTLSTEHVNRHQTN